MSKYKILYLITTYSPSDNNKNYFRDNGYVYRAIESVLAIRKYTEHSIDLYIVDCASGPSTRQSMLSRRSSNGYNMKFLFGPDLSGSISVNLACNRINHAHQYDFVFFSASDAILQNPRYFNKVLNNLKKNCGCHFAYLNAQPGLELPKQKLNIEWFSSMAMNDSVHYNAFCVDRFFLKFYNNRILIDSLMGAAEVFMGYYCHAAGSWRKIVKLNYLHLPKTGVRTDRKTAYTNKNKCRGDGFYLVPSEFTNRSFEKVIRTQEAIDAGIFFELPEKNPPKVDRYNMLDEESRLNLERFVKKHFLLNMSEFNYDSAVVDIC